ncbi:hypothetical protein A1Q2_00526 [Trichosporon asahii var. asahii CBS 8904]|uniref:Uncharacterized protein n=1 Tax=Trichosporon asahii var. asahii (strain CBS 8904) TaxID=1220162 RepID=K1VXN3_TRIAC|nr:hypothetical protein A1Q2_00526 [Trichosporon asahii var. asahii CBS 8904]
MTRPQKIRDVQAVLRKNSWVLVRQVGSHQTWVHCTCNSADGEHLQLELEFDTDDGLQNASFSRRGSACSSPTRSFPSPTRANSVRIGRTPYPTIAEYSDVSSAASSSCSSTSDSESDEEPADTEEWFGSRRALERRQASAAAAAPIPKSAYASVPHTASRKERRRPQLKLDTFVEAASPENSATPRAYSPSKASPTKASPTTKASPLKSPTKGNSHTRTPSLRTKGGFPASSAALSRPATVSGRSPSRSPARSPARSPEREREHEMALELPQLASCSCFLRAFEEAAASSSSPTKGPGKGKGKGLGTLRSRTAKELTRHADRITIASKRGGEVDPKCIMQLKRVLQYVPDDW